MLGAVGALALGLAAIPFLPSSRGAIEATDAGAAVAPVPAHEATSAVAEAVSADACPADAPAANLDFVIKDMNGNDVRLADYKGQVIMFNLWATWCGPCKYEIPTFVELQEQYRGEVQFLGFSVDDPVDKLKAFASEYKMNYPVLVGLERDDVQEAYGPVWGIPVTIMISRDGKICKRHMGLANKAQFEAEIKKLL